jgi:hypothetical protein
MPARVHTHTHKGTRGHTYTQRNARTHSIILVVIFVVIIVPATRTNRRFLRTRTACARACGTKRCLYPARARSVRESTHATIATHAQPLRTCVRAQTASHVRTHVRPHVWGSGPGVGAGGEVRDRVDSDPGLPVERPSVPGKGRVRRALLDSAGWVLTGRAASVLVANNTCIYLPPQSAERKTPSSAPLLIPPVACTTELNTPYATWRSAWIQSDQVCSIPSHQQSIHQVKSVKTHHKSKYWIFLI